MTMKIEYHSNNSGGSWWLSENDWLNLEADGWAVEWLEHKFLGARATKASKDFPSVDAAVLEFEKITGLDAKEKGCDCCGSPHYFSKD